jgi:hypothetical protein
MVKPDDLWIVAPLKILDEFPAGLDSWMTNSGCVLGLGDGIGLNYVTTSIEIASAIENLACHT